MRSQEDIDRDNRRIESVLSKGSAVAIDWLRAAFHTHEDSIAQLLASLDELRNLLLMRLTPPLTVQEARACKVCRVCGRPALGPLVLNYGDEFAHQECLEGGTVCFAFTRQ